MNLTALNETVPSEVIPPAPGGNGTGGGSGSGTSGGGSGSGNGAVGTRANVGKVVWVGVVVAAVALVF